MDSQYHIHLLTETLGESFTPQALEQIIAANLGQDALRYQLGAYPHYHFDNNEIGRALAYVNEEHARISELARVGSSTGSSSGSSSGALIASPGAAQRGAFGRLTHAVHDFYAHSNYVDLWLEANGGLVNSRAEQIDGLDPALLNHPQLFTGSFLLWFDSLYYLPGLRPILRKIYLRPKSHEVMNLDSPAQGPKFAYAMIAAKQRTLFEYERVRDALRTHGGKDALDFFHRV